MLNSTAARVENQTAPHVNRQIEQETRERVRHYRQESRGQLTRRLRELDQEWDTERTLQTNFATLSLVGIALAATVDKRWAFLSMGVPAFMVQHALQGWCPPLSVLRRKGFRTSKEINQERFALKCFRGDFDRVSETSSSDELMRAVKA